MSGPKVMENFRCTERPGPYGHPSLKASDSPAWWVFRPCLLRLLWWFSYCKATCHIILIHTVMYKAQPIHALPNANVGNHCERNLL